MTEGVEGQLIAGRYRVGERIGSGAMSIVHAAVDLRLSRPIALKFSRHDSLELTERLFREARAAARSNHPAVITVFAYGTDDDTGLHYLAMERLQGSDLATRIAEAGSLPVPAVLRMAAEIADALACVHETGVVHRDLKPANIFLARRGLRVDEIKLLDFGVARQAGLQSLTTSGDVVGTLAYMAPEQLLAPKRVDSRSDIYALGVVLFECLTGRRPYQADNLPLLAQRILSPECDALAQTDPKIPPAVMQIIRRCMARDPNQRFDNARQLCDAVLALGVQF